VYLKSQARLLADTIRLLRSQWWSTDDIRDYQGARLLALLRYAVEHVPFYAALGVSAEDIRSLEDLRRFPVVTKADVQARADEFLSREFEKDRLRSSRSSGMTGEPTVTYFDESSWLLCKYALKARRVLSAIGASRQRVLILSDEEIPDESRSAVPRLGAFFVDVRGMRLGIELADEVKKLASFRPTVVYGFPSYLAALADAAARANIEIPKVPVIYTSSEVLTSSARAALERAYGGHVIDIYGSTEFKEIAVQCQQGRYHVNFESVYVESHDESERLPKLLVTSLVNKAMPLIRYELGDTGKVESVPCACGRQSEQLVDLQGRVSEMLVFPDGAVLSPYLLEGVVELHPAVKHFRIVHEQPWALRIEILAQPAMQESDLGTFAANLRRLLPTGVSVRFAELRDRGTGTKRRVVLREF
jgi:phenylacetate-CoA ligase